MPRPQSHPGAGAQARGGVGSLAYLNPLGPGSTSLGAVTTMGAIAQTALSSVWPPCNLLELALGRDQGDACDNRITGHQAGDV